MRQTWLWLFFLLINVLSATAQDNASIFAPISAANAQNLIEIRTWATVRNAVFSPDGTNLVLLMDNGSLEFISTTASLELLRQIDGIDERMQYLQYRADGSELLLTNNALSAYYLLDLTTGEMIAHHDDATSYLFGFSADFRRYLKTSIGEHYVSVHNIFTSEELLYVDSVEDFELSRDGNFLVTRKTNGLVQVWDINSHAVIFEIQPPSESATWDTWAGAGFTPDGKVWVNWTEATTNGETWTSVIQFWDIASATIVLELDGNLSYNSLLFEPTNKYVLAWGLSLKSPSNTCSLWNILENREIQCPAGGNSSTNISPNGQLLAVNSGSSPNVNIYEIEAMGRVVRILETENTWAVIFSPDSRFLVTIDFEAHLWIVFATHE